MVQETRVHSRVESYQRLKKWYLMPPCLVLSTIRWGSRVKWSNPGKGVAPSPTPQCRSYRKGSLWVTLDYGRQQLTCNSDIPTFIFPQGLRINMETYIKCLEEVVLPWIKRMTAGRLYICTVSHKQVKPIRCQKVLVTTSPLTSDCLTLQIAISLIIMCKAQLNEKLTKLCATLKMNWRQG